MTVSIADAVADLLSRPAPVLLLDTCNLLDFIRSPMRRWADEIAAAEQLRSALALNPNRMRLVVAELVPSEWASNITTVRSELQRFLNQCQDLEQI